MSSVRPIDKENPIPYYVQLKQSPSEKIEPGEWHPGERLPSEPSLCQVFDVTMSLPS